VLSHWSGLGLLRPRPHCKKAAQVHSAEHNGEFPVTTAIGAPRGRHGVQTAAAILAAIPSYKAAILDGNVKRVG